MPLIDELLKDDFFHGGFHPVEAPPAPVAEASGKRPIALIAGIAAGVLALGGGAAFYFLKGSGGDAKPAVQTAAVVPPVAARPVQPAPVTAAAEAVTVPAQTAATAPADAPIGAAAEAPAGAAAPEAPAAPAAPVEPKFRVVFPKTTNKAEVDKILAELKAAGIKGSVKEGKETTTAFEVHSLPSEAAAANALKVKASLFKIDASVVDQGEGKFMVDFGTYRTREDAQKVIDALAKFNAPAEVVEGRVAVPSYQVRTAGLPREQAEDQVSKFTTDGIEASMEQTP